MSNTPTSSRQSCTTIQRDIREVMAHISRKRPRPLLPPRQQELETHTSKKPTGPIVSSKVSTKAGSSNGIASKTSAETVSHDIKQPPNKRRKNQTQGDDAKEELLENAYARHLFFRYTNITEVAAKRYPERSATTHEYVANKLYRKYVLEPKLRIRKDLHEVRFQTRYHEGLFRMAIQMPITSTEEHTIYKRKLATVGIKQQCFVDMTVNNQVLEYQGKIVETLKERFENWSGKLDKLSTYLMRHQQQRELDDNNFRTRLVHSSSLKGSWPVRLPHVVERLVQEYRLPSEKRNNLLWSVLRFNNERFDEKYETGGYSRFQNVVCVPPDERIYPPLTTAPVQEGTPPAEDCEMPMAPEEATSSAVQTKEKRPEEPRNGTQTSSPLRIVSSYSLPPNSMMITNESWEREIEISPSALARQAKNNEPSAKPTSVAQDQPHRTDTNQPKPKSWRKDPILRAPCPIRAACISYESSTSADLTENQNDTNETSTTNNQSIAFVSIRQENFSQNTVDAVFQSESVEEHRQGTTPSQDSAPPDTEHFTPFVTSTQNQSQTTKLPSENLPVANEVTQDPLHVTAQTSTIEPFYVVELTSSNETGRQNANTQTPSQPSSAIPPFQLANSAPNEQSPPIAKADSEPLAMVNYNIKRESLTDAQTQTDSSGYADYVEILPSPASCITIADDSSTDEFNTSLDPINERVCQILTRAAESTTEQAAKVVEPNTTEGSKD
uniref:Uncharacterized protein n=1 Tax=Anopheles culicifacies TaxID=139723 RepID=A0A182MG68_9DIPT